MVKNEINNQYDFSNRGKIQKYNFPNGPTFYKWIKSITSLDLGINFMNGGKILKVGSIPNSIKILDLGYYDLELLENVIPDSVTYLLKVYHPNKNQLILPKNSIKSLLIRYNSILPADNRISINVQSIQTSVTKLDLETGVFPIDSNSIPSSITPLEFREFNIPITKSLLESCKDSLKIIKTTNSFHLIIENDSLNQCLNLKTLEFYEKVSLASLSLCNGFDQLLKPGLLQQSLRSLYLGSSFNKPMLLNSLPNGLLVLKFNQDSKFNHPIEVGVLLLLLLLLPLLFQAIKNFIFPIPQYYYYLSNFQSMVNFSYTNIIIIRSLLYCLQNIQKNPLIVNSVVLVNLNLFEENYSKTFLFFDIFYLIKQLHGHSKIIESWK
ncbi:hypothetical protein ACTFIZ_009425 [Dictyostelium cf. discoideum]